MYINLNMLLNVHIESLKCDKITLMGTQLMFLLHSWNKLTVIFKRLTRQRYFEIFSNYVYPIGIIVIPDSIHRFFYIFFFILLFCF